MARISPTVRQRRLGHLLRDLRADRPASDIAGELGWARTTLTRLEDAPRKPQAKQISRLLDVYGVPPCQRGEILELVAQARQRGWWERYRGTLSSTYDTYVGLEAEAKTLRNFESATIPGLLQTPAYARALISSRNPALTAEEVEARVAVRTTRQDLLTSPEPVTLWAILAEGTLHRQVGGPEVLRQQVAHLRKMAELPNVTLQVLTFEAGAAPTSGPFVVLSFIEPRDHEVAYLETAAGDIWIEDQAGVNGFLVAFERLIGAALPAPRTREWLDSLAGA